jgi:Type II secretion system (T2SS), protein M subtype b
MTVMIPRRPLRRHSLEALAIAAIFALTLIALALSLPLFAASIAADLGDRQEFLSLLERKASSIARNRPPDDLDEQAARGALILGATTGLLSAELQRIVTAQAASSGVVITRMQPLESDAVKPIKSLRMEIEASGSMTGLRDFVHGTETGLPLIFISEAHIAAGGGDAVGTVAPSGPALSIRLTIEAYGITEDKL